MAKSATPGEMRTRITVKSLNPGADDDGYKTDDWTTLLGGKVYCKWVGAHGNEVFESQRLNLGEVATITMRYTAAVNQRCRIWYENDDQDALHAWEIISVDDVEDRHRYLEIKVKRKVAA